MKKENVKTEKQQLKAKANGKEAYKKPALSKHQSLRDITGLTYNTNGEPFPS